MATARDREINQMFMDAWDEFCDGKSTGFLITITADRCKCDYGRVVDALEAVAKFDALAKLKGDRTVSIDWTPEAIEAALNATTPECNEGLQYVLIRGLHAIGFKLPASEANELARAALDAAVKAQGESIEADLAQSAVYRKVEQARAEALEEAAAWFEKLGDGLAAAAIRALKETKG